MKQENEKIIDNLPKLKWSCRRGMLELDIVLTKFLSEAYLVLPKEHKILFVNLLEQPDPKLFRWLLGSETPEDPNLAVIVDIIRANK